MSGDGAWADGVVTPARMTAITYRFPVHDTGSVDLFAALVALLAPVPGIEVVGRMLHLVPRKPVGALPITVFTLAEVATPEIAFAAELPCDLSLGALRVRGTGAHAEYLERPIPAPRATPAALPANEIVARLAGHVTHIDHTGVNLPTAHLDSQRWGALLRALANSAALYRYPDGEPWPFILPTSDEEFTDEIYRFAVGRLPKFELVYDDFASVPIVQLALGTDLTRAEVEQRFPAPHGVAFPGLGEFFRAVFVAQPWAALALRLDLYYASADAASDWDTGEWLVRAGGRIR